MLEYIVEKHAKQKVNTKSLKNNLGVIVSFTICILMTSISKANIWFKKFIELFTKLSIVFKISFIFKEIEIPSIKPRSPPIVQIIIEWIKKICFIFLF